MGHAWRGGRLNPSWSSSSTRTSTVTRWPMRFAPRVCRSAGSSEELDRSTEDAAWLPVVAARGWVIATRDGRMRHRPAERSAILEAGAILVVLLVAAFAVRSWRACWSAPIQRSEDSWPAIERPSSFISTPMAASGSPRTADVADRSADRSVRGSARPAAVEERERYAQRRSASMPGYEAHPRERARSLQPRDRARFWTRYA